MPFKVDTATVARAQIDAKRGTYDPKNYDLRPPIVGLLETIIDNIRWQPNFSWEKRPTYVDGTKVEDGDLVVLAARRRDVGGWRGSLHFSDEVHFCESIDYNTGHYLINQRETDRAKAEHFQVKKVGDRLNLVHVESGIPLNRQGIWVGVHPDDHQDASGRNIAFDKGSVYFETSGKKSVYATDSTGNFYVNVDSRGFLMSMWPVKVED